MSARAAVAVSLLALWLAPAVPAGARSVILARGETLLEVRHPSLIRLPTGDLFSLSLPLGLDRELIADDEVVVVNPGGSVARPGDPFAAPDVQLESGPVYGRHVYEVASERFYAYADYVDQNAVNPPTVSNLLERSGVLVVYETDRFGVELAPDNCPGVVNPDQADSGGVDTANPDGIGDACQCSDVTLDGIVAVADADAIRGFLADPASGPSAAAAAKCPAGGTPAACDVVTAAIVLRALAGLSPGIAQVCPAAVAGS